MENYEDAAESRLDDWEVLSREKRKAGSIHMGGIYIECLLKSIICSMNTVADGSRPSKWNVNGNDMARPGHDFTEGVFATLLGDIYDDMPDTVMEALQDISHPGGDGKSFIDYRYVSENEVLDNTFEQWMVNFIEVFSYLDQKKLEV
jgi:hypothetical protein